MPIIDFFHNYYNLVKDNKSSASFIGYLLLEIYLRRKETNSPGSLSSLILNKLDSLIAGKLGKPVLSFYVLLPLALVVKILDYLVPDKMKEKETTGGSMSKKNVTVEVEAETYDFGQAVVAVAKNVKQALADGWQPGQDIPAIVAGSFGPLSTAVASVAQLGPNLSESRAAFIRAWALAGADLEAALFPDAPAAAPAAPAAPAQA